MKPKKSGADIWVIPLQSHNIFLSTIKWLRWHNLYLGTLMGVITQGGWRASFPCRIQLILRSQLLYFTCAQEPQCFPGRSEVHQGFTYEFALAWEGVREKDGAKDLAEILSGLPKCSFLFSLKFRDIESNSSPLRVRIKATAMYGSISMCQEMCLISYLHCLFLRPTTTLWKLCCPYFLSFLIEENENYWNQIIIWACTPRYL